MSESEELNTAYPVLSTDEVMKLSTIYKGMAENLGASELSSPIENLVFSGKTGRRLQIVTGENPLDPIRLFDLVRRRNLEGNIGVEVKRSNLGLAAKVGSVALEGIVKLAEEKDVSESTMGYISYLAREFDKNMTSGIGGLNEDGLTAKLKAAKVLLYGIKPDS